MGLLDAADAGVGIEQITAKDKIRKILKHNVRTLFLSIFPPLYENCV
jgi:hypothetical protein